LARSVERLVWRYYIAALRQQQLWAVQQIRHEGAFQTFAAYLAEVRYA